jgi:hypothetical protein
MLTTGTMGFGSSHVIGLRRVPFPPARIIAFKKNLRFLVIILINKGMKKPAMIIYDT